MRIALLAAVTAMGLGACSQPPEDPATRAQPDASGAASPAASSAPASAPAHVVASDFGTLPDGRKVQKFVLDNGHGMTASIITYGGILQALTVPDRNGKADDVVLGYDTLDGYLKDAATVQTNFGALIGRYANRLAKGRFTLDGKTYQIPTNNNGNTLHGGPEGFATRLWEASPASDGTPSVTLRYRSPDGEMGFPGTLDVSVVYTLQDDGLKLDYTATTDKPTVLNLTSHGYFNLAGAGAPSVLDHRVQINAARYTQADAQLIPTGKLLPVDGTPLDFRTPHALGERIHEDNADLRHAEPKQGGYDFNWVLDAPGLETPAVIVEEPTSGRTLTVFTTEPGMQLYTSNAIDRIEGGKGGKPYLHWGALALEAQHFPDSPNHADFPSTRLDPGQTYRQTTIYRFGVTR
ncbi:aldose epimerase family protein [Pseudoxanthomonas winnipegensis]|jgi:aldose 1-epimerase|uniref:Aldose 1-epimerase n=1 Tax=Pseudoxanthomonas winnipegensis TaxID=2480810 RepID=A0A4Q8L6L1_9GAMM|nr:aldose epimerase family protein [Pseudoxanthomonas winnipegensis]TAA23254.1 galactose mutarotase [Pseudoxanthomonas winnipegensis]